MCEFTIPQLLYYTHIPTLVASLFLAFFVFNSDRKNPVNRYLSAVILFFSLWTLINFIPWFSSSVEVNLFFVRVSPLIVFSMLFFHYFSHELSGQRLDGKRKILLALPFLPVLALLFTDYNAQMIDKATCTAGYGHILWYYYVLAITYLVASLKKLFKNYRESADPMVRKQVILISSSFAFLIIWFVVISQVANSLSDDSIYLYSPLGIVVFSFILTIAIARYKFLNIKLALAQVLTYAIWILIASQFFFVETTINYILTAFTLVAAFLLGIFLIRSVKSEMRRAEELQALTGMLSAANERLRVLDKAKSEFVSIASHQLRTPLTALKGFTSLLMEGDYGSIPESVREVLEKMRVSNDHLIHLVEDLLSISRIESGKMQYRLMNWDLSEIVRGVNDLLSNKAKEKGIELTLLPSGERIPEILIDGDKIREVITNIVDNAIKYSNEGFVHVSVEKVASGVRVTVADSGVGIDPRDLPYLFEKFSRGHNTKRLSASGTGLGLFVARNIVKAHGGRIWAESDGIDRGSRFILELPLNPPESLRKQAENDTIVR